MIRKLTLMTLSLPLGVACGEERIATTEGAALSGAGNQVSDSDAAPQAPGAVAPTMGAPLPGDAGHAGAEACTPQQPRRTIVQWSNVQRFSRQAPNTFQVVLFENGDFAYVYRSVDVALDVPSIGYQGAAGVKAFELDVTPDEFEPNRVVYFRVDASGTPVVEESAELSWFDAEIAGAGLSLLDEQTEPVALPFAFPFLGAEYSEVRVSSNGFLGLSAPFAEYANTALPNSAWGAMLAIFWDDLDPAGAGTVSHQSIDECAPDCQGKLGGLARVDRCGVCAGGNTGLAPDVDLDCKGVCFGNAAVDACGTCGGTSTDAMRCGPKPDLVIDSQYMAETVAQDFVDVSDDACLVNEGCVTGMGVRRVVRFGTRIANIGTSDLIIGAPESGNPLWELDACHGHYHFESHAQYDLIDVATARTLPIGVKNGFCLRDDTVWDAAKAVRGCENYDCDSQGISAGCSDVYAPDLDCQWVDITDVAPGDYTLRVTTNPNAQVPELDYTNNSATVQIRITADQVSRLPPP